MPTHKSPDLPVHNNKSHANDSGSSPFGRVSFSSNMLYWTRLLETSYNRAYAAQVPKSISVSVWRVLAWLSEKESLTVGELALHTHMERTVLGRLLDRMAKQGLIVRDTSTGDRRISKTRISPAGRLVFAKMQPLRDAIYAKATKNIPPADVETARRVVMRMVMNLADPTEISEAKSDTLIGARRHANSLKTAGMRRFPR